jgi:hypothetical protein
MRGRADGKERAEGAARDGVVCRTVAGVEAALEADLHERPGALDLREQRLEWVDLERYGLLAEHR